MSITHAGVHSIRPRELPVVYFVQMSKPKGQTITLYTLSELARHTGVTRRTVQYYAEIGLLEPGAVTKGGRKLYTDFAAYLVRDILDLKQLGFSLEEIKKIMALKKAIFYPDGTYREDWTREEIPLSDAELESIRTKTGLVLETIQRQSTMISRFYKFLNKHFGRPSQREAKEDDRLQSG